MTETPVADAANKAAEKMANVRFVGVVGESERLWKHVLFGTGTCVGMIEGYAALGMPGDPLPHLHALVDRIGAVIKSLEEHKDEGPNAD